MEQAFESFISDLSGFVYESLTINYYHEPRTTIYHMNERQPSPPSTVGINSTQVPSGRVATSSFYPPANQTDVLGQSPTRTNRTYVSQSNTTRVPISRRPIPIQSSYIESNRRSSTFGTAPLNYTSSGSWPVPPFNLPPPSAIEPIRARNYTLPPPPGVNTSRTTNIMPRVQSRLPSTRVPQNNIPLRNRSNIIPIHIELTDNISGTRINGSDIFSDIDTLSALATSLANLDALTIEGLTVNETIEKTETSLYQNLKENSPDEVKCHICNEEYDDLDICRKNKLCNHFFHQSCIDNWYSRNKKCPICNQYI